MGRDRSGGGLRSCVGGLLAVGSCSGNATKCASVAADRVSRTGAGACGERADTEMQCDGSYRRHRVGREFFCWYSGDGAVLGAGCGCFSCGTKLK